MTNQWTWDKDTENSIIITKNGKEVAQIVNESGELTEGDFTNAEFITEACNRQEALTEELK